MRKYIDWSIVYAVLALAGGVFFREFTKLNGFEGATALGVVHTHWLALGMAFFLLLFAIDRVLGGVNTGKVLIGYHVGLNLAIIMLLVRGMLQVLGTPLPSGADAAISGIAGIGHIILGVSLVMVLLKVRKTAATK